MISTTTATVTLTTWLSGKEPLATAAALTDLMNGRIQLMFDNLPTSLEHIRDGRLRPLAVTSAERWPGLPHVPPLADFVPGFEASGVGGVGVPAGTPTPNENVVPWYDTYGVADGVWRLERPVPVKERDEQMQQRGVRLFYYGTTSATPDHLPEFRLADPRGVAVGEPGGHEAEVSAQVRVGGGREGGVHQSRHRPVVAAPAPAPHRSPRGGDVT